MENRVMPPEQHSDDPFKRDVDPVAHALERLQTYLVWIDEHRSSFEMLRNSEPDRAETELVYLKDSIEQALSHLQRLLELLMAGHTIDPNKRLPKWLSQPDWLRAYLDRLREGRR
jgi:hypothetical protein